MKLIDANEQYDEYKKYISVEFNTTALALESSENRAVALAFTCEKLGVRLTELEAMLHESERSTAYQLEASADEKISQHDMYTAALR